MIDQNRLARRVGALFDRVNPNWRAWLLLYWWGLEKEGSSNGLGRVRDGSFNPYFLLPLLLFHEWHSEVHIEYSRYSTCRRPSHICIHLEIFLEHGTTWNSHEP